MFESTIKEVNSVLESKLQPKAPNLMFAEQQSEIQATSYHEEPTQPLAEVLNESVLYQVAMCDRLLDTTKKLPGSKKEITNTNEAIEMAR